MFKQLCRKGNSGMVLKIGKHYKQDAEDGINRISSTKPFKPSLRKVKAAFFGTNQIAQTANDKIVLKIPSADPANSVEYFCFEHAKVYVRPLLASFMALWDDGKKIILCRVSCEHTCMFISTSELIMPRDYYYPNSNSFSLKPAAFSSVPSSNYRCMQCILLPIVFGTPSDVDNFMGMPEALKYIEKCDEESELKGIYPEDVTQALFTYSLKEG